MTPNPQTYWEMLSEEERAEIRRLCGAAEEEMREALRSGRIEITPSLVIERIELTPEQQESLTAHGVTQLPPYRATQPDPTGLVAELRLAIAEWLLGPAVKVAPIQTLEGRRLVRAVGEYVEGIVEREGLERWHRSEISDERRVGEK